MRVTLTALCALLSVAGVASVPAQAPQPVPVGSRVRITMVNNPSAVVGRLIAVSDSALHVRRQRDSGDVSIPRSLVDRLEVSRGSGRGASARNGAIIGLVLGGVLGFATGQDCSDAGLICFDRRATTAMGASAGTGIGALIGLVVGGRERWRDAAVPMSFSVVPLARSVSIGSRLAF